MSILGNQTLINEASTLFSGETSFVSFGATTSPYVLSSNLVLSNSASIIPVQSIASTLYPDVGKTYFATASGFLDPAWASGPSGGTLQVNLLYKVGSNVLYNAKQVQNYDSNVATAVSRFSIPLMFQHSDSTGSLQIGVVNQTGTATTSNTTLQIDTCSVTEMSSRSLPILSNAVSNIYTP